MGKSLLLKFLKTVGRLMYLVLRFVILIIMLTPVLLPIAITLAIIKPETLTWVIIKLGWEPELLQTLTWVIVELGWEPELPKALMIIALLIGIGAFSYLLQRNIETLLASASNTIKKAVLVLKNIEVKKNLIETFTESKKLFVAVSFLCIIVILGNFSVKKQTEWQDTVGSGVDTLGVKADNMAIFVKAWKDSVTDTLDTINKKTNDISDSLSHETQAQRQYRIEQRKFNRKLQEAIDMLQAKIASIPDSTEIAELRTFIDKRHHELVDSVNNKFHRQTMHLTEIKGSLKVNFQKIQEQHENFHSVFVYVVIKDSSEYQKYLEVRQSFVFFKKYKIKKFPDIDSRVVRKVGIGDTLCVQDTIVALYDYKGKLREGKEYTLIKQSDQSQTLIVFSHSLIAGQRILAVTKK